jgi:uncharacterized paraquat-inducible protein A
VRCHRPFAPPARGSIDTALALTVAALLLLLPAASLPLMRVTSFGVPRRNWLPTGVEALWNYGFTSLSIVVFIFSIAIPFIYLGLMIWVLGGIRIGPDAIARQAVSLDRGAASLGDDRGLSGRLLRRVYAPGVDRHVGVGAGGWCLLAATQRRCWRR